MQHWAHARRSSKPDHVPEARVTPVTLYIGSTVIAGGLYPAYHFGPTRLNVADDGTRGRTVRDAAHSELGWVQDGRVG